MMLEFLLGYDMQTSVDTDISGDAKELKSRGDPP